MCSQDLNYCDFTQQFYQGTLTEGEGGLSTVDLLVLTSLDQLTSILNR